MAVSFSDNVWLCEDLQQKNQTRINAILPFIGGINGVAWLISDYMIGPVVHAHDLVWIYEVSNNNKVRMSNELLFSLYDHVTGPHLFDFTFDDPLPSGHFITFHEFVDLEAMFGLNIICTTIPAKDLELRVWADNSTALFRFPLIGTYRGTYCGVDKLRRRSHLRNQKFSFRAAWYYKTDAVLEAYQNLHPRPPVHVQLLHSTGPCVHDFGFGWFK